MKWKAMRRADSRSAKELRAPHPGGGELVITPDGEDWLLYHYWPDRRNFTLISAHRNVLTAKDSGELFVVESTNESGAAL